MPNHNRHKSQISYTFGSLWTDSFTWNIHDWKISGKKKSTFEGERDESYVKLFENETSGKQRKMFTAPSHVRCWIKALNFFFYSLFSFPLSLSLALSISHHFVNLISSCETAQIRIHTSGIEEMKAK